MSALRALCVGVAVLACLARLQRAARAIGELLPGDPQRAVREEVLAPHREALPDAQPAPAHDPDPEPQLFRHLLGHRLKLRVPGKMKSGRAGRSASRMPARRYSLTRPARRASLSMADRAVWA